MGRLRGGLQTVLMVGVGDGSLVYGDVPGHLLPPLLLALPPQGNLKNFPLSSNFVRCRISDLLAGGDGTKRIRLILSISLSGGGVLPATQSPIC